MMRIETQKKLAEHLINVANHEKRIEAERIVLNEIFNFQPSSAFKRVDRLKNYKINAYDIATFMRDNNINVYSSDVQSLIKAYDADNDGHLDMIEFQNIVLTQTDYILARRAKDRYEEYVGYRDKLSLEVEYRMARLLQLDNEGINDLNKEKSLLLSRYDFSRLDAFRAIDKYRMNSILRDDLRIFLNQNGVYATVLDVDNIMKRLDLDRDGRITYSEFCDYLEKSSIQESSKNEDRNQISYTPDKKRIESENTRQERQSKTETKDSQRNKYVYGIREDNSSPLRRIQTPERQELNYSTPVRNNKEQNDKGEFANGDGLASLQTTASPNKQEASNNESPEEIGQSEARKLDLDNIEEEQENLNDSEEIKEQVPQQVIDEELKEQEEEKSQEQVESNQEEQAIQEQPREEDYSQKYQSQSKQQYLPGLDRFEEKHLVDTLKTIISLENDIEKSKQSISLKADFNLFDAFKIFDKYNLGQLFKQDLEEGFSKLGIYAQRKEVDLFFKRYDVSQDHKIRYLEFSDAFSPKDKIYADHLNNKRPNYGADESMSYRTKLEFADTIRTMLKCEGYAEEIRQNLQKRHYFTISGAFQTIDTNNNGSLTKLEFRDLLEKHDFYATVRELDFLFDKLDRDRDSKVSYSEFFSEMAPKYPF